MADVKKEEKKEEAPSFDFGNFFKSIFWVILVILVVFFSFLIVIVNEQTALNFIKFLNALEILFGVYLVYLIYKFIDYTYKFQHWSNKIGEFYGSRYKPDDASKKIVTSPIRQRFEKSIMHISSPYKEEWKIGIIELDTILKDLLIQKQYIGDTVGELLKDAEKKGLKTLDYAWEAHKIRNKVVHEGMGYEMSKEIGEQTLRRYRSVFEELGI
jgi:hypothetical protein